MTKSRILLAGAAVIAAALAGVLIVAASAAHRTSAKKAEVVAGPTIGLDAPGRPTLVAFLATESKGNDPSNLQVTTVKSMATQYGDQGLSTVIVDTSHAPHSDLVNYTYDWQLGQQLTLMSDPDGATVTRFHVTSAPTTILLDAEGRVLHTWTGLAVSQDLAAVIQTTFKDREP